MMKFSVSINMKIGYIQKYDLKLNPHLTERFKFIEAPFTRTISSKSDKISSKILASSVDYEEIVSNTKIMKENNNLILTCEPFFLDDELKEKVTKWVEWANKVNPKEYEILSQ